MFQWARETHQSRALLVTATHTRHRKGITQGAVKPPRATLPGWEDLLHRMSTLELWRTVVFFFKSPTSSVGLSLCKCIFQLPLSTASDPSGLSSREHSPSFERPCPGAQTLLLGVHQWGHSHLVNQHINGRCLGFLGSPFRESQIGLCYRAWQYDDMGG